MTPDRGGKPLPPAPVCLAGEVRKAKAYVATIDDALGQEGWAPGQRAYLKQLRAKWVVRALGMDDYFMRRGNIPGSASSPPPTHHDLVMQRWRLDAQRKDREERRGKAAAAKIRAEEKQDDKNETG